MECLAAADRLLTRAESSEIRSAAREPYLKGTQLLNGGKAAEAVDYLRDAYAAERENPHARCELRKDPNDVAAYEGLGHAELEQGQYRTAHNAFQQADASNPPVRKHLETLDTVRELDPTLRHLTSAEKYNRSIQIYWAWRGWQTVVAGCPICLNAKRPANVSREVAWWCSFSGGEALACRDGGVWGGRFGEQRAGSDYEQAGILNGVIDPDPASPPAILMKL